MTYKPLAENVQVGTGNPAILNDRDIAMVADGAQLHSGHANTNFKAVAASRNGNVGSQEDTDTFDSGEIKEIMPMAGTSSQPTHTYNGIAALCRRVLIACEMGSLSCLSDQNLEALGDKGLSIVLKEISAIFEDAKPAKEDATGKEIGVGVKVLGRSDSKTADVILPTYVPLQALSESPYLTRCQDYPTEIRLT